MSIDDTYAYNETMIVKLIKATLVILALAAVAYITLYAYAILQFSFVWQCRTYTGELTKAGQEVCANYNDGGLIKVLTN